MSTGRVLRRAGLATAVASGAAAFYYRPDPSSPELLEKQGPIARKFKTPVELTDHAEDADGPLLTIARALVIGTVAGASRVFLFGLNNTTIVKDERWRNFVGLVESRPTGTPLLTVANHSSTLDDPTLFAAIVPLRLSLRPSLMRWCVCSEEICFETAALSTFFGAGKVLPIARGPGVDQKLLLDFGRRLAAGEWCSIFPEGKTVQSGHMGGRQGPRAAELGRLKWGVGKLIAHAPTLPIVVPFFHTGMQEVVPEHPVSKDVLDVAPTTGNDITIRIGDPIKVGDLLEAYEKKHGPLRRYHADSKDDPEDWRQLWLSTPEERTLYSAIARRIEEALAALEAEARAELGDKYPGTPKIVATGEYKRLADEAKSGHKPA